MEAPFEFKMRTILCLNRNLPYGTTGPDMDFFEAAFEGDIPRLRGKPIVDIPTWNRSPLRAADAAAAGPPATLVLPCILRWGFGGGSALALLRGERRARLLYSSILVFVWSNCC
jgi:hypothetical protein